MTEASSFVKFLPYTPRKVALVASQIRGKNVAAAQVELNFMSRRASGPVLKALNSAVANLAVKMGGRKVEAKDIKIIQCVVNQGPVLKRIHPGSMGRAMPFKRKMCHLMIQVKEFSNGTESKS